jgi:hypothetical protein
MAAAVLVLHLPSVPEVLVVRVLTLAVLVRHCRVAVETVVEGIIPAEAAEAATTEAEAAQEERVQDIAVAAVAVLHFPLHLQPVLRSLQIQWVSIHRVQAPILHPAARRAVSGLAAHIHL